MQRVSPVGCRNLLVPRERAGHPCRRIANLMEITLTKKHIAIALAALAVLSLNCFFIVLVLWTQAWGIVAPAPYGQGSPPSPPQQEPFATEPRVSPEYPLPQENIPAGDWGENIPTGGLGNETLRRDVWRSLQTVVSCPDATAADVLISPQDDTSETWDIWCPNGGVDSYIVFYKDGPNGGIDFAIGKLKEE